MTTRIRGAHGTVVADLARHPSLLAAKLDPGAIADWCAKGGADDERVTVEVVATDDDGTLLLRRTERHTGAVETIPLPPKLFAGAAYEGLRHSHQVLLDLIGTGPYTVTQGRKEIEAIGHAALRQAIFDCCKDGIEISRFKGLGEMNSEQLRETAMAPSTRTLLQVNMESAAEADALFVTLMGDQVEDRRAFIESHARDAQGIDV
jgi:DNA gyrase subunit B